MFFLLPLPTNTQQRRICTPVHPQPNPTLPQSLPAAQPNCGGQRGAKSVNSFEHPQLPLHSPQTLCPQQMKSCLRQKEMGEILCT